MTSRAVLLIPGFTGAPGDFGDLAERILASTGVRAVAVDAGRSGEDPDDVVARTAKRLDGLSATRLVLVGHSTGGAVALAALADHLERCGARSALVVLAGTPPSIDGAYLERWEHHRAERASARAQALGLADLGRVAALVRRASSLALGQRVRGIVLHGADDALVPPGAIARWTESGVFREPPRSFVVPRAGHHLFEGEGGADAVRLVTGEIERFFGPLAPTSDGGPAFLNVESTTRCPLSCPMCARRGREAKARDMTVSELERVLEAIPSARRVTFVGLGEPTAHPEIERLVSAATEAGRRVSLVTNAALLSPSKARSLIGAGLSGIAFSLDAVEPALAARLRPGADITDVLGNIRGFLRIARDLCAELSTAVFTAVSNANASQLPGLVETVVDLGVDALMLSDLNFARNAPASLRSWATPENRAAVREAVRGALRAGLPVVGPRSLEALDLAENPRAHLLVPPDSLWTRPSRRTHCESPWRTAAVGVDGGLWICDCRPDEIAGNLFETPFAEIWNGPRMREARRELLSEKPAAACRVCPRL